MDGTPDSYKQTKVLQPQDQLRADEAATARVQTADDEVRTPREHIHGF